METLDVGKLVNSVVFLSNLAHVGFKKIPNGVPLREYQKMKDGIDFICAELERLELQMSLISASELRSVIYEGAKEMGSGQSDPETAMWFMPLVFARYKNYADDLVTRLTDELSVKMFMTLPSGKVGYFDGSKDIFPITVRDSFPSAEYDMDESGKCFALGRHTAVFHQMRIMEIGLNTLGTSLGLSIAPNWGCAINDIENEIRSRSVRKHGPSWKADEPFYSEAATHFRFVKNAWRNHTMHGKDKYDEELAKTILNSVSDCQQISVATFRCFYYRPCV